MGKAQAGDVPGGDAGAPVSESPSADQALVTSARAPPPPPKAPQHVTRTLLQLGLAALLFALPPLLMGLFLGDALSLGEGGEEYPSWHLPAWTLAALGRTAEAKLSEAGLEGAMDGEGLMPGWRARVPPPPEQPLPAQSMAMPEAEGVQGLSGSRQKHKGGPNARQARKGMRSGAGKTASRRAKRNKGVRPKGLGAAAGRHKNIGLKPRNSGGKENTWRAQGQGQPRAEAAGTENGEAQQSGLWPAVPGDDGSTAQEEKEEAGGLDGKEEARVQDNTEEGGAQVGKDNAGAQDDKEEGAVHEDKEEAVAQDDKGAVGGEGGQSEDEDEGKGRMLAGGDVDEAGEGKTGGGSELYGSKEEEDAAALMNEQEQDLDLLGGGAVSSFLPETRRGQAPDETGETPETQSVLREEAPRGKQQDEGGDGDEQERPGTDTARPRAAGVEADSSSTEPVRAGAGGVPTEEGLPDMTRWEQVVLTRLVLSFGTAVRALDLQEQHILLVLALPCSVSRLVHRLYAKHPSGDALSPVALAAELPWRCAFGRSRAHPEALRSLLSVAAKGPLLYVRCRRPRGKTQYGTGVWLAASLQHRLEGGEGDAWAAWEQWWPGPDRLGTDGRSECRPSALNFSSAHTPASSEQESVLGSVLDWWATRPPPPRSSLKPPPPAQSTALLGRRGFRLVMEAVPQSEGMYVFATGLVWRNATRWFDNSDFTCHYKPLHSRAPGWQAPAVLAFRYSRYTVVCPHPPDDVRATWADASPASGNSVRVTLADVAGRLPSAAFYDASLPIPDPWRSRRRRNTCPAPKQSLQRQAPKHFLCACTMIRNKAKFLLEWSMYHAWLGVEHFFFYDNNSDDNLKATAHNISQSIPHPLAFEAPYALAAGKGRSGAHPHNRSHVNISVIPWPWVKTQQAGFSHCILQSGPHCEWVLFTDIDEFVYPGMAAALRTREQVLRAREKKGPFLRFLLWRNFEGCKKMPVGQWLMDSYEVGPSGNLVNPDVGVAAGYSCRRALHLHTKAVVRPEATSLRLQHRVHAFKIRKGYRALTSTKAFAAIYHFRFQAWEEYKTKFIRRVAAEVADWMKERTRRWDGVTIKGGVPRPPKDWPSRFCHVRDGSLVNLVRNVFSQNIDGKEVYPWQGKLKQSKS